MSAAVQPVTQSIPATRTKPDRRRHLRVALQLDGRFLFEDTDHSLRTADISCGGARIDAEVLPPEGQDVICYFDDLGRVMGKVVRHVDGGFAIVFEASSHKRDKLADRLVWLVNHKKFDLEDERAAPRKAAGGPALITRANGTKLQCRVIDISLTGAAFEYEGPIPFVGEIVRAGSLKGEVVRSVTNEFAIHFLHKPKSE
ncbi:MAG: PilZ domain-containing protein [Alphaproteobacteria bacterium]|nr:PilZ domain-containing protein [Alphaproteobacteria bacterium]